MTPIKLKEKYLSASHGRFQAKYDHQPGVTFKDPQGRLHLVPDKRLGRIGKKARATTKRTFNFGDL